MTYRELHLALRRHFGAVSPDSTLTGIYGDVRIAVGKILGTANPLRLAPIIAALGDIGALKVSDRGVVSIFPEVIMKEV
jgi:hypothetical protein